MKLLNILLSFILMIGIATSCGSKGGASKKEVKAGADSAMNCAKCPMAGDCCL